MTQSKIEHILNLLTDMEVLMANKDLSAKIDLLRKASETDFSTAYSDSPVSVSQEEFEALTALPQNDLNSLADALESLEGGELADVTGVIGF